MQKRAKRPRSLKKITTKPIGRAIQRKLRQLRAARAIATPKQREFLALNIRALESCYKELRLACKDIWACPSI